MTSSIATHPDRLLPADPGVREIARRLHAVVESLPIISPHGHVDAAIIAEDTPFPDPTALLISPDHYVTRVMHSAGVPLDQLRVGGTDGASPREAWRTFCRHWPLYDGTASGYWLRQEFVTVFGIDDTDIREETADEVYDAIQARINEPDFRPRALMESFGIEVLATTDDPLDDLAAHDKLAADDSFAPRVLPTFRPDAYTKFWVDGFAGNVDRLIQAAGDGKTGYDGYIQAFINRRQYFVEHGAVSSDHGTHNANTLRLDHDEAAALFDKGMAGTATFEEALAFEAHMIHRQAGMAVEDGLVMTLHPGVHRNTHSHSLKTYGPDTGHDVPFAVDYSTGLKPLLDDYGTAPGFHFVPFTIDETVYSRELAPIAGFYPSVFIGAPWWFLDAPDAMMRFRGAITETAGFSRTSGFIDDTRAFCSIPARHDASRRVEASFLARLVAEHRITEERAAEIIFDLVDTSPRRVFKL